MSDKPNIDDAIKKAVADTITARIDRLAVSALGGDTSSVAQEQRPMDVGRMLEEWRKIIFSARRNNITFVVEAGHAGPIMTHETQGDGTRVEMSYSQACELHKQWPLKLQTIIDAETAEFVPAMPNFDRYVPRILPRPPYEVPHHRTE